MRTEKAALILYFIACFCAILALVVGNDLLMLLTKPTVIPAIYFYYLSIKKKKVNLLFASVLFLNFISDTIALLNFADPTILTMFFDLASYLILIKFAVEDLKKMKFEKIPFLVSLVFFIFLLYLLNNLIQLFSYSNPELVVSVAIYGSILALYGAMATYCYSFKNLAVTFFMLITALSCILSDVFYIMFNLIFHFPGFNYFEFGIQLLSYFFMVKYFVLRRN
jgi:hypothetical protein